MAFAISAKNPFSSRPTTGHYSALPNHTQQPEVDPRFAATPPWAAQHNAFRVTDAKSGKGYITDNRASNGEKAQYR